MNYSHTARSFLVVFMCFVSIGYTYAFPSYAEGTSGTIDYNSVQLPNGGAVVPLATSAYGAQYTRGFLTAVVGGSLQIYAYDQLGALQWTQTYPIGQLSSGFDVNGDGYPDALLNTRVNTGTKCISSGKTTDVYKTRNKIISGLDGSLLYETDELDDLCDGYAISWWGNSGIIYGLGTPAISIGKYTHEVEPTILNLSLPVVPPWTYLFPSTANYDALYTNDTSINTIRTGVNQSFVDGSHVQNGVIVPVNNEPRIVLFTSMRAAQYAVAPKSASQLIADRPFIGGSDTRLAGRNYGQVAVDPQNTNHVANVTGVSVGTVFQDMNTEVIANEPDGGGERHVSIYDLQANTIDQRFISSVIIPDGERATQYHNRVVYPAHYFLPTTTTYSRIVYNLFKEGHWYATVTAPGSSAIDNTLIDYFVWDVVDVNGDGTVELILSPADMYRQTKYGYYFLKPEVHIASWNPSSGQVTVKQKILGKIPFIIPAPQGYTSSDIGGWSYPVLTARAPQKGMFATVAGTQVPTFVPFVFDSEETQLTWDSATTIPKPSCWIEPDVKGRRPGELVKLTWSSTNAVEGGFSHGDGTDGTSGNKTLPAYPGPSGETYYYTAYGPGGLATCNTTVFLSPLCQLTANKSAADMGEAVQFTWSSTDATSGGFSHGTGSDGVSGTRTVAAYPNPKETFSYTAYGPGGLKTCSTTVTRSTPPPTCQLTLNKPTAAYGELVTLTWSSTNAVEGGFSHGDGTDGASGSKTLPAYPGPTGETYYYTAYAADGRSSNTCTQTVYLQ